MEKAVILFLKKIIPLEWEFILYSSAENNFKKINSVFRLLPEGDYAIRPIMDKDNHLVAFTIKLRCKYSLIKSIETTLKQYDFTII